MIAVPPSSVEFHYDSSVLGRRKKINPYPTFGTRVTPAVPPNLTTNRPPHSCTYYTRVFDNAAPLRQHYLSLHGKIQNHSFGLPSGVHSVKALYRIHTIGGSL